MVWSTTDLPGAVIITATAEGKTDSAYISVLPGPPAKLVKISGDKQVGDNGERLPALLIVRVLDRWENAVTDATVRWTTTPSGKMDPATARTDSQGYARTFWTLGGKGGTNRIATATLVLGDTTLAKVEFTATVP